MSRATVQGKCHICGGVGDLSFEHTPPESAFNNRPVRVRSGAQVLRSSLDDKRGKSQQRGSGKYTLCERCNNLTGKWYGAAYVDWAYQGLHSFSNANVAPSLYFLYRIFPLRVIKQIITIFFSVNSNQFSEAQPELVRFVLNRDLCYLPHRVRVFAFLYVGDRSRSIGVSGLLNFRSGSTSFISEFVFSPFGFVLCLDSEPPDPRLVDITWLSHYGYHDWKEFSLRLPVLPIYTAYPADYRDRETVLAESAAGR